MPEPQNSSSRAFHEGNTLQHVLGDCHQRRTGSGRGCGLEMTASSVLGIYKYSCSLI